MLNNDDTDHKIAIHICNAVCVLKTYYIFLVLFVQTVLFIRVLTLNYVILEVSPTLRGFLQFPPKGFPQFPPLMREIGETYIANPGGRGGCNEYLFWIDWVVPGLKVGPLLPSEILINIQLFSD